MLGIVHYLTEGKKEQNENQLYAHYMEIITISISVSLLCLFFLCIFFFQKWDHTLYSTLWFHCLTQKCIMNIVHVFKESFIASVCNG